MDIRNTKQLKAFARDRVAQAPAARQIGAVYAGTVLAMTVLVQLLQFLIGLQINKTSGLGSMGTRSILSAIQTTIPFVQMGISLCLGVGYQATMLRIARGQYVSHRTLKLGFDRFWTLLRMTIMEALICSGAVIVSLYASTALFVLTPLSSGAMEVLMPLMSQTSLLNPQIVIDEALYGQLVTAMIPLYLIFAAVLALVLIPILMRYRMAEYVLIDKPGLGGFACLRESGRMMKGNIWKLLRLDFSLWWYHALAVFISVIGYGDQILLLLGMELPWSVEASFYIFLAIYQVLQFLLVVFLRSRVETSYALAYDSLRPQEPKQEGVVLGNIFQM